MPKGAITMDFPSATKNTIQDLIMWTFQVFVNGKAKEKPTIKQYHNIKHPEQYLA